MWPKIKCLYLISGVSICATQSFSIRISVDAVISAAPILELLSINHIERNIK